MATPPRPGTDSIPPQEQPRPGPLPTEGDKTREVGKRALEDVRGPKEDTDGAGYDAQRNTAPTTSPIRRSDKKGVSNDR